VITWHKAVFSWLVMRLVMRPVVCKQHETVQLRSGLKLISVACCEI